MAKLVGLPPVAWECFPAGAQGCDTGACHKTGQYIYFFYFIFSARPSWMCSACQPGSSHPSSLWLPEVGLHRRASRAAPCLQQGKPAPQHKEPRAGWEAAARRGDTAHTCPGTQPRCPRVAMG